MSSRQKHILFKLPPLKKKANKKVADNERQMSTNEFMSSINLIPKYHQLKKNRYLTEYPKVDEVSDCFCSLTKPCGSRCLNYELFIECDPKTCRAKDRCRNQRFQQRQFCQTTVKAAGENGFGLFANEAITHDQFIIEYIGDLINADQFVARYRNLKPTSNLYVISLTEGYYIDSSINGNEAHFANHSCSPNAKPHIWIVNNQKRVGIFAIRDINPGDEITFDYGWGHNEKNKEKSTVVKIPCKCHADDCKKFLFYEIPNGH